MNNTKEIRYHKSNIKRTRLIIKVNISMNTITFQNFKENIKLVCKSINNQINKKKLKKKKKMPTLKQ